MSMLDSFFSKGFKAAKCKTLLKLTIPRIKLLRNRREIQIKQMRREIAKLLETGQEATARIRVEHIIREEKMMAAQEIIELFCELIAVRLPIIEAQRFYLLCFLLSQHGDRMECPLDLKEAISSVCFAAPRCADLTELMQVQMLFAAKYGKEFLAAATELMPECGVNRQLIELLSVRAPAPDVKLKLLKEIAEEHNLDWDASASETELFKPHEDLLNGPTQFVSGSKLPLPKEKYEEPLYSASGQTANEPSDSDADFDPCDFPEVPKASLRPNVGNVSAPEMLPFPASALSDDSDELEKPDGANQNQTTELNLEAEEVLRENSLAKEAESANIPVGPKDTKQYLPFITPPSLSSASFSTTQSKPRPPSHLRAKSEANVDLQDVLNAAQAAAESAERAAAAARSAASLAQLRISELTKRNDDKASDIRSENPFHEDVSKSETPEEPHVDHKHSLGGYDEVLNSPSPPHDLGNHLERQPSNFPSYDDTEVFDSSLSSNPVLGQDHAHHQPQRLTSMDDELYSYPNLFTSQASNPISHDHSLTDNSRSTHEL
ncbi:hypothetical protein RJ640_028487 [Escallonia rubra]|uniref:IST1-like protein n=1 Tax=Escallonia rubra TaxID=112253 RepID=A0AA88R0F2_9ASTE|nr:hypothetical protein RJ640_006716 [Escallonia rubra]KAK2987826.1 hypothetical protein RJ640_028487 [Escallonia rubra]